MLYVRTYNEWLRKSPNAINGGRDEYGNDIVLGRDEEADIYDVVLLSKEDIANRGYDPTGLTREDMRKIADNIGETLCYTSFWDTLDYWCTSPHKRVGNVSANHYLCPGYPKPDPGAGKPIKQLRI